MRLVKCRACGLVKRRSSFSWEVLQPVHEHAIVTPSRYDGSEEEKGWCLS
jgi:hypothetical protein